MLGENPQATVLISILTCRRIQLSEAQDGIHYSVKSMPPRATFETREWAPEMYFYSLDCFARSRGRLTAGPAFVVPARST